MLHTYQVGAACRRQARGGPVDVEHSLKCTKRCTSPHSNISTVARLSRAHGGALCLHGLPWRTRPAQAPVDGAGNARRAPAQRRGARDGRRRRRRCGAPGGALRRPRQRGRLGAPIIPISRVSASQSTVFGCWPVSLACILAPMPSCCVLLQGMRAPFANTPSMHCLASQACMCPPWLLGKGNARVNELIVQDLVRACSVPGPDCRAVGGGPLACAPHAPAYLAALLASVPERGAACDERRLRPGAFVPRVVAHLLGALGAAHSQAGLGSEPGPGLGQAPAGALSSCGAAEQQGGLREALDGASDGAGSQPAACTGLQGWAGPAAGPAAAGAEAGAAGARPGERRPPGASDEPHPQGALEFAGQLLSRLSLRGSAALVARALWAQLASQPPPGGDPGPGSRVQAVALRVAAALGAVEDGAALERLLAALLLEAGAGVPADPAGPGLEGLCHDAAEAAAAELAGVLLAPGMLARHTAVGWGRRSAACTSLLPGALAGRADLGVDMALTASSAFAAVQCVYSVSEATAGRARPCAEAWCPQTVVA